MNLLRPIKIALRGPLRKLHEAAPSGYAIALHVKFARPTHLFKSYSPEWSAIYDARGYVISDPTVIWAFENDGVARWSELRKMDKSGMLSECSEFGMNFGVCVSTSDSSSKSMASFSRPDREYDNSEIDFLKSEFLRLHHVTLSPDILTDALVKRVSIYEDA